MHGNVTEWVEDCMYDSYAGAPTDGSAWTSEDCSPHVLRGGDWIVDPPFLRSSFRYEGRATKRQYTYGFRISRDLDPGEASTSQPIGPRPGQVFSDCADCPAMVVIPAGSFRMGNLAGDDRHDEKPAHKVSFNNPFAVGKFEVTQAEWRTVMGSNPSHFRGEQNPVDRVSWHDARAFARRLSAKTGKRYRLLSEAEWEYAARGGTETKYPWGNDPGSNKANCDGCGSRWDNDRTAPVGSFTANAYDLHDMHGNLWEWVEDCRTKNYIGAPTDGSAWISGPCKYRVLRGGSWYESPDGVSSADRGVGDPDAGRIAIGLRIARSLDPGEALTPYVPPPANTVVRSETPKSPAASEDKPLIDTDNSRL